jgi:hypothetical protein
VTSSSIATPLPATASLGGGVDPSLAAPSVQAASPHKGRTRGITLGAPEA